MLPAIAILAAVLPFCAASPINTTCDVPPQYLAGFMNAKVTKSPSGFATCITGLHAVRAPTINKHIDYPFPANQSEVTLLTNRMYQAGSTLAVQVANSANVSYDNTYNISTRICYSPSGVNASAIQFLTHGLGFGMDYWAFAPGFSYVDAAARAGYTTFLYDRLGVGASDHPDALQIVQYAQELSIAHALIQALRAGAFARTRFAKVAAVGHSFGSALTNGITARFPADLDAAALTGFSTTYAGIPTFFTSMDLAIAREAAPRRFPKLDNGYLLTDNAKGAQFAFLREPNFPARFAPLIEGTKQTVAIGEMLTQAPASPAPAFRGAVNVVEGQNDWPFCLGDCEVVDPVTGLKALYPNAVAFANYTVVGAGHGINLHCSATAAFEQMQSFFRAHGI